VNEGETRLAEADSPAAKPAAGIPWGLLVRSGNMWLSGLMQFGINLGWVFLITRLPRYLSEVHKVPIEERAVMTAVPLFAAWVGMFTGGLLTDFLTARLGRRWGRALPIGVTQVVCCLVFLTCPWLPGAWLVIVALSVMAVCVDLGVPAIWAFAQDVGGRNVGATVGWGNMWGNLGAAASPVLLSQIQGMAGWPAVFVACAVAFLVASLAGFCLDASRPLSPPQEPAT
jgi:MFS family permease